MSVTLRAGVFGDYYGNDYSSSNALSQTEMEINATYIYSALLSEGWTINSIAAILGNMQAESSINPGRWQSDRVGGDTSGHGYSLVQWTPYTKYTEWCSSEGFEDPSEMDSALARIKYEVENNIQWIARGRFKSMSFKEFTTSVFSVSELAAAFLLCYERPADQSIAAQQKRANMAKKWYTYLTGVEPNDPNFRNKKRKGYKFVLFNRKRRGIYG